MWESGHPETATSALPAVPLSPHPGARRLYSSLVSRPNQNERQSTTSSRGVRSGSNASPTSLDLERSSFYGLRGIAIKG